MLHGAGASGCKKGFNLLRELRPCRIIWLWHVILGLKSDEARSWNRCGDQSALLKGRSLVATSMKNESGSFYFWQQRRDIDIIAGRTEQNSIFRRGRHPLQLGKIFDVLW